MVVAISVIMFATSGKLSALEKEHSETVKKYQEEQDLGTRRSETGKFFSTNVLWVLVLHSIFELRFI